MLTVVARIGEGEHGKPMDQIPGGQQYPHKKKGTAKLVDLQLILLTAKVNI